MELIYVIIDSVDQLKVNPQAVSFEVLYRYCYSLDLHHGSIAETLYGYLANHYEINNSDLQGMIDDIFMVTRRRVNSVINKKTHIELTYELWKVFLDYCSKNQKSQNININNTSVKIMCNFLVLTNNVDDYLRIGGGSFHCLVGRQD